MDVQCECGTIVRKSGLNKHKQTQKHIRGAGLGSWMKKGYSYIRDKLVRNGYNNTSSKTIQEFGNWKVAKMWIYRKPIESALDKVMNLISLGTWQKQKDANNYDNLFHLGLFCLMNDEKGRFLNCLVEKNAVIEVTRTTFNVNSYGETLPVHVFKPITLIQLLDGGQKILGNDYFKYDPFKNNCQMFVRSLLTGAGLYGDRENAFVFQPVESIVKNMPSYVPAVARVVTDLGAVVNRVMGSGLVLHAIKIRKDKMGLQEAKLEAEHIAKRKGMKYKEYKTYHGFRVIPKTKLEPKSYRSKKVKNGHILLVFGKMK